MAPRQCEVCNGAQSKYKCPACLAPYCSLVCFKKHKEIPCVKPVPSEEKPDLSPPPAAAAAVASESYVEKPLHVDEPNVVLLKSQLESIAASSDIRDSLKDENLLKLIQNIDCSPNAEMELDNAMGVEVFRIFSDKVLSAIAPSSSS